MHSILLGWNIQKIRKYNGLSKNLRNIPGGREVGKALIQGTALETRLFPPLYPPGIFLIFYLTHCERREVLVLAV